MRCISEELSDKEIIKRLLVGLVMSPFRDDQRWHGGSDVVRCAISKEDYLYLMSKYAPEEPVR